MTRPIQLVAGITSRLRYLLFGSRRGDGQPISKQEWDHQYKSLRWNYLNDLPELDHYSIIVGYIRHLFPSPDILELGCGHGRLVPLLLPHLCRSYMGVDLSAEAISQANQKATSTAKFVVADFESWVPQGLVDVVIFNESVYYAKHPTSTLSRYISALKPGGRIIVSMHDSANHHLIWRNLESILEPLHGVHLRTDAGVSWVVRVFQPLRATPRT
jgi:SAM-dependent methyltransferase